MKSRDVTYLRQSDLKYTKNDLKLGKNDLKYYDLKWDFLLGGLINLQLQTSDFVDVDFGCDHCRGSSKQ